MTKFMTVVIKYEEGAELPKKLTKAFAENVHIGKRLYQLSSKSREKPRSRRARRDSGCSEGAKTTRLVNVNIYFHKNNCILVNYERDRY